MRDAPSAIRAHQSEQSLELVWGEGAVHRIRYHTLRGQCPCATCRDEWTGKRLLDPSTIRADLQLEGMEPIGSYAVRLVWNDGHSSGLFTWDALQSLGNGDIPADSADSAEPRS